MLIVGINVRFVPIADIRPRQRHHTAPLNVTARGFTNLRVPKMFNLRTDPYERADITSNIYYDWLLDHAFLVVPAQDYVGQFLATFKNYLSRQKAASFNLDEVMRNLTETQAK